MKWLRNAFGWAFGAVGLALPAWLLPAVLIAAGLSTVGGAYIKGRLDASTNCKAAQLAAELASVRRDLEIAKHAEAFSGQMAREIAIQNANLQKQVQDYEVEIASRPLDSGCRLNGRDIDRLNRMRLDRGR